MQPAKEFPRNRTTQLALENADLLAATLLVMMCAVVAPLFSGPVRIFVGLAATYLLPGYALLVMLFPRRSQVGHGERVVIGLGLSIALVTLIGLVVTQTPWRLTFATTLAVFLPVDGLLLTAGLVRRLQVPSEERFIPWRLTRQGLRLPMPGPIRLTAPQWALALLLALGLAASLAFLAVAIGTTAPEQRFTQFYLLNAVGDAAKYPTSLVVGEPATVRVVVHNQEQRPTVYRVEVLQQGKLNQRLGPYSLARRERIDVPVRFSFDSPGEGQRMDFLLYRENETQPYRSVRLFVNVQ